MPEGDRLGEKIMHDVRLKELEQDTEFRKALRAKLKELEAENERLRGALKRISTLEYQKMQFEYCKQIAKAALQNEVDGGN